MTRNNYALDQVIEKLRAELAEWDSRLEASGVEDATAWEHFPEMERVMYALAERELERNSETSREEIEREISEWDAELSDALDEMAELCLDDEDDDFEYDLVVERIECAEFWIAELESELESLLKAHEKPIVDEDDQLIEWVHLAEESALAELAAFGNVEFECGVPWAEWAEMDEDDSACVAFEHACFAYDEVRGLNLDKGQRGIDLYELY